MAAPACALQVDIWQRKGRHVIDAELDTPAKTVSRRGTKDDPKAATTPEELAEVHLPGLRTFSFVDCPNIAPRKKWRDWGWVTRGHARDKYWILTSLCIGQARYPQHQTMGMHANMPGDLRVARLVPFRLNCARLNVNEV